jgi:hypothetical protein
MNPTPLSRIQAFREQVLLPALTDIKALIEGQATIVRTAETGQDAIDAMLQQMHFGKPYLPLPSSRVLEVQAPSIVPQIWVGDSIYIESLNGLEADPIPVGQYCLSIEFRMSTVEHIQVWSIIGYTKTGNKALQLQQHLFEDPPNPLSLEQIDSTEILLHFTESFKTFEDFIAEPATSAREDLTSETLEPDLTLSSPKFDEVDLASPTPSETPAQSIPQPSQIESAPAPPQIESAPASQDIPSLQPVEPILTPQQQLYALQ